MLHDDYWPELRAQAQRVQCLPLREVISSDGDRGINFTLRVGGIYGNFSRQHIDAPARDVLHALASTVDLPAALRRLFDGEPVNVSEARPALHTALRSSHGRGTTAIDAVAQARAAREKMAALIAELEASEITDIVNIGIGGSDLGPRLLVDALRDFSTGRFRIHFLNNADASAVQQLLPQLQPEKTAVVLVSKSFGTQETLLNGQILRQWLQGRGRMYAVSANIPAAQDFGIPPSQVLPMWDWVGGRYSLWSAVGFSIALAIGMHGFERLLAGAAAMDAHVLSVPVAENMAMQHALFMLWNRDALGMPTHAVLPYDQRLTLLPDYLQQLVMESLGKSVRADGSAVPVPTVPMLWGGTGTSAQHSFFQALHQGADQVPIDFVGVIRPAHGYDESQRVQLANLLAQAEALANGHSDAEPQRQHPGGRPSTLFLLDELSPENLGGLLAMYEHSVYCLAVLWGINAFDQWGVELGKQLASRLLPALAGEKNIAVADAITRDIVDEIRQRR